MSLSHLETECLLTMRAEPGTALTAASLHNVLRCIGRLPKADTTIPEVEAACMSLIQSGHAEAVHSARLGRRFRIMRAQPGC